MTATRGLDPRVGWPARSWRRQRHAVGGVVRRVRAGGLAVYRHGPDLRYVTHCSGFCRGAAGQRSREAGRHFLRSRQAAAGLRRLSPLRSMRWALWTTRSRMASASVGSPTISYQWSTGTWLVMISERAL